MPDRHDSRIYSELPPGRPCSELRWVFIAGVAIVILGLLILMLDSLHRDGAIVPTGADGTGPNYGLDSDT
jgi:hypothetical protein